MLIERFDQTKLENIKKTKKRKSKNVYQVEGSLETKKHNELYYWGILPFNEKNVPKEEKLPNLKKVLLKEVRGNEKRIILLTLMGDVYVQDYTNNLKTPNYDLILDRSISKDKIIDISLGSNHILGLTNFNYVYSWGEGMHGELGFGDKTIKKSPSIIRELKDIISIGCGTHHSIAINRKGELYYWGTKDGMNRSEDISIPSKFYRIENHKEYKISCGCNFTLVLARESGSVYSFGLSKHGQCGQGELSMSCEIKRVKFFSQDEENKISEICCGSDHSLALSVDGDIFSWGRGNKYQLGKGTEISEFLSMPLKINTSVKFKKVTYKVTVD